jgi:hypothetical protein
MDLHSRDPIDAKISAKEIRTAFETLIKSTELYMGYCVCFFIDGLDEYEETCEEDYEDMASMLLA